MINSIDIKDITLLVGDTIIRKKRCVLLFLNRIYLIETQKFINNLCTKAIYQVSKGTSLKLYMFAESIVDICQRLVPTMEWDTAAADAIVRESDIPVIYNKENLLNP